MARSKRVRQLWVVGLVTGGIALSLVGVVGAQDGILFVEGTHVGIGAPSPTTRLEVVSDVNNGNIVTVRATDAGTILRVFETLDTGGVLSLYDGNGSEDFRISATGDSWFNSAGEVGIDCASPDHDLTIGGSGPGCNSGVFSEIDAGEAQFTTSSSRTIKENLRPVRIDGIVDEIGRIPVYAYDFVDGPRDRIGLVAEDFHRVFRRGDETMLSGHEVQMALWLAVQALAEQNRALSARVTELEAAQAGPLPSPEP